MAVWIEAINKSKSWPPKVMEDVEASILVSDLEMMMGNTESASSILKDLREFLQSRTISLAVARQIQARVALSENLPIEKQLAWRRYLAGWGELPPSGDSHSWIELYLRARRAGRVTLDHVTAWEKELESAKDYVEIRVEWKKMLAGGWFELGEYEKARGVYESLAKELSGDARLLVEEHARRMRFLSLKKSNF